MPRWVVHSRAVFEARHALTSYQGRIESPHDHCWEVAVKIGTEGLNDESLALDFCQVHQILEVEVNPLRGTDLSRHPEIGQPSPTAERIAEYLAQRLGPKYKGIDGTLISVSVWEGPENRVDLIIDDSQHL